jgi:hypothetical protein
VLDTIFHNKGFFHFQNYPLPYSSPFREKESKLSTITAKRQKFLPFLVSHSRICFREEGSDFIFAVSIFAFCLNLCLFVDVIVICKERETKNKMAE